MFGTRSFRPGLLAVLCLVLVGSGCNQKGSVVTFQPAQKVQPTAPLKRLDVESPPVNEAPPPDELIQDAPPALSAPLPQAEPPAEFPPGILYSDSFADLGGGIKRHEQGKQVAQGPRMTRQMFFFAGMPKDGELILQMLEDAETLGPDGQPGVIALSWQEVPPSLPYSGFVYLGRSGSAGRMTLPRLQQAASSMGLEGVRLKFRFKGLKSDSDAPVKINIGFRLEPALPDSYAKRLDLGRFVATEEWGAFNVLLSEGTNMENFFRAIAEEKPTSFKLVWSQGGPIKDYQAGDTLLLDDIEISKATAE